MGAKGFVEGGIASIVAGCSTHPLDLIKVRMQLQGESAPVANPALRPAFAYNGGGATTASMPHPPPAVARAGPVSVGVKIFQTEGVAALFSGISATVLRQTLYSTTRMGLYEIFREKWTDRNTGTFSLPRKITAGLLAGGIGAAVGNPADVAMVRMQADGRLPAAQRRNYKGVADAITRMVKQEGVTSLWRGSTLTVNRAMIVTASQLASYDQIKETILKNGVMADGLGTHVTASFAAGFVASVASNPVDVIKTRVMNMKVEEGVAPPYKGAVDCALKTVRAEGPMALYKGFIPTISRQGPFTVVLFVTLEQVRLYKQEYRRASNTQSSMAFKQNLIHRLFHINKCLNQTLKSYRISSTVQSLMPPNPDRVAPDPGDDSMFLQRRPLYLSSSAALPEIFRPGGQKLLERLREMDIARNRVRLDGLIGFPQLTVTDAKKILRASQIQMVKSKLRSGWKNHVSYDEFIQTCVDGCCNRDQGVDLAKALDDSGSVIVLGKVVFLKPEQVVKAINGLMTGDKAEAPVKELEEMERWKSAIDDKAEKMVRRELWGGLGYLVVQTVAFMRLTFWELSWDVMEPICFYVTSMYFMVGYAFFIRTSKEPSFEGIFQSRFRVKQNKLMKMEGFDIEKYKELKKACGREDSCL